MCGYGGTVGGRYGRTIFLTSAKRLRVVVGGVVVVGVGVGCWLLGLVLVVVVVGGGWCMVAAWLVRGGLWAKKSPAGVDDGAAGVETMCLLGS